VTRERERERAVGASRHGIPIGNLTSQIFANIYLNELDRFIVHTLRPQAYLRYGDDFIVIGAGQSEVVAYRTATKAFLTEKLRLALQPRNDIVVKGTSGLKFLGVEIFPSGRRLRQRILRRVQDKLTIRNSASYRGLMHHHQPDSIKWFDWLLVDKSEQETVYE
jgi:hypothetical protein